ncbi:hypothetical protein HanRHA438_Chr14g0672711 [Helianthus annuus]|nr:hypothetical protein HanRHA438_Chr14g0672711 [Helianthus annuus]
MLNDFATSLAHAMNISETIHTLFRFSETTTSWMNFRKGCSRAADAWKSLMIWVKGKPSVFSELGGRWWSEELKGRGLRWS